MSQAKPPLRASWVLDRARVLARIAAPDNLVWQDEHLLFSSGPDIFVIDSTRAAASVPEPILHFDAPVSALAGAPDGSLAVGLGAAGVRIVGGARDGLRIAVLGDEPLRCPTALCFTTPDVLFVCQGSASHGSVWRADLGSGDALCLGAGLAYPGGLLLLDHRSRVAVSESARQRLLAFDAIRPGAPQVLCDRLPGCPGRAAPAGGGGVWLTMQPGPGPAHEDALALRLDPWFRPLAALHGGWRGVSSCLEVGESLLLACRDSGTLIASDLPRRRAPPTRA